MSPTELPIDPRGLARLVVGLAGPNASGKGAAAAFLVRRGFAYLSLSDVVRAEARRGGLDVSRESLIATGQRLRREEGPGVMADRLAPQVRAPAIVDSVRHPAEVERLRRLEGFRLLGIDAPLEVRWRRALARNREGDRPSLEVFAEREARENSERPEAQQLSRALALADALVVNEGSIEQLEQRVAEQLSRWAAELAS